LHVRKDHAAAVDPAAIGRGLTVSGRGGAAVELDLATVEPALPVSFMPGRIEVCPRAVVATLRRAKDLSSNLPVSLT